MVSCIFKTNLWVLVLIVIQITIIPALDVIAQTKAGNIAGTVKNGAGVGISFASIVLKDTEVKVNGSETGSFHISNVESGVYSIVVSAFGFKPKEVLVTVVPGETATLNIILEEDLSVLDELVLSGVPDGYSAELPSPSLRIQGPLIEKPQNIQVVTKEVLEDQQAFDILEGIQRNVSGAQKVEHWDNYARINMRGSQITAFRNGMNVQMPWGPLAEDMSMVERVEFVKGPAGFMISSGEPGGFYNIVTKKPTGVQQGEISMSLGSFDLYRATADIDGKLSENGKLVYRVNAMGQLKGSHRDFEFNNRYSFVPVIKYLIDDKTSVTLEYTHQYLQMSAIGSNYAFSKRGYGDLPVNFTTAEANLRPSEITERSVYGALEHMLDKRWKLTAKAMYMNYNQVGQSLWPTWVQPENDSLLQRGVSIWDALGINKNGQVFVNGSVNTGFVSHIILGGVDMTHKNYFADWMQSGLLGDSTFNIYEPVYGTVPASELPVWDRSRSIRERGVQYATGSYAAYLQDEMGMFQNKLRLTLAGRYTVINNVNPYSGSTNDGKFTPRIGVSYSIKSNTTAYFLYDQSFIGNPGIDWQGNSFSPVTAHNVELGLKKKWFNDKWQSTVAAYRITKNNVLTTDLQHADTSGQFVFKREIGQQMAQGIELDIRGQIIKNLSLIVNYAFTDARITKDSDQEVVGNTTPGATRNIQNTWLSYKLSEGALKGVGFSLGYQYHSGRSSWYVFDGTENALPDYLRFDGGISYQNKKLRINMVVNNLLNEYLFSGAPYYGIYYWQTEPKRNGRITVTYLF